MDNIDKRATTTKAIPVQKRSPVKTYTRAAMMIAGIRIRKSFIRIIIIKPIMTRTMRSGMLIALSPKLLRTENIMGKNVAKFMS